MMRFWVNGEEVEVEIEPGEMLSDVLRYRLGLTGTKVGCEEAECGTCTVHLDGKPVLACTLPANKASGRRIKTVEGLAREGDLHPLQEAFIQYGAVQCGFCIPGQLMTATALLDQNPDPDEDEIRYALKDTLCRCGGYPTILRAILAAAKNINNGTPILMPDFPITGQTQFVGKVLVRPDAEAKVRGEAKFCDDLVFPQMLHGKVLRAGVPHAILKRLNVEKARTLEGVQTVLTATDIPGERNHGLVIHDWPVLVGVGEKVRYVGDAVALVAADTSQIATQALSMIEAEYESLPVVSDPIHSYTEGAPTLHEAGNLLKHIKVRKGDVERGFQEADNIFEDIYFTSTTEHAYLEPECSIARPLDDGRIEVYVGSQIPYADRRQIARCLGVADDEIRVVGTPIGGGFGGKEDIAGQIHAALLAQRAGRPVKVLFDRRESFHVHPKRHATQIRVRLGVKADGTLVAAETELYGDTGAYASLGEKVMTRTTTHSTGPYVVPHVRADCFAMYTNNPPAGAFRGFGVTQSCFAIESAMDMMAECLGLNPIEFRRLNALRVGTATNTGQLLSDSVGLIECIDRTEDEMRRLCDGADPFVARNVEGYPYRKRAWGFAIGYKNTGLGGGAEDRANAEVELFTDGTAEVRTSSAELGQGLVTVLQMIAAEQLTIPPENVRVFLSDTDLTPDGGPTTASRQTYVTGNAVRLASDVLLQAVKTTLAERFDCPPERVNFSEGLVQIDGRQVPMAEAVKIMKEEGSDPRATYEYWAPKTQPLGEGGDMHFAFSFAAQAAEVEVDLETGEARVLRVIAAHDVGRAINPLGLQGQVEGGVVMGMGNALMESFIVEEGQVFTDRFARYRIPSIVHSPDIHSIVVEHPTREGPFGAKGIGELSSIPTTPAITNAIYNASGVRVKRLPVDQDWLALELKRRGI
ncbi:MAG: molybdopterin-dependent oxidoreductase [Anaerolineales bacterium]|nr:molybdopterin-dependent oxidoreductase [Anaerolineales bacterium]